MKKLIICLSLAALAFVPTMQAGADKSCDAAKTACADKAKTASAEKSACSSKTASAKKGVSSAKGAALLVQK